MDTGRFSWAIWLALLGLAVLLRDHTGSRSGPFTRREALPRSQSRSRCLEPMSRRASREPWMFRSSRESCFGSVRSRSRGNTRFSEEEIGELYPKPGNLAQWAQLKRANSLLKGKYRDLGYRVVKIKTRATTQKADTSRRTEGIFNYRVQIGEGPQS